LILGVIVLLTAGFGWLNRPAVGQPYDPLFAWILAAFWIPAGAAICVWGEFALRMQAGLSYEQLLNLDPSRWRPGQRLLITVGIAFIFAFLLAFNAIQVGLGSLLLNEFATKTPPIALAVGGVTGLAFSAVQDIIYRIKPTVK
jgi:heme/copper-type cytochrome/quinol oxidase subunit 3